MLFEIGVKSVLLVLALASVTMFFCQVEVAPAMARRLAKSVRFRLAGRNRKSVRVKNLFREHSE